MKNNPFPPLRQLASFVADAERLNIISEEAQYLKQYVGIASQMVEKIARICSRRSKKRTNTTSDDVTEIRPTLTEIETLLSTATSMNIDAPEMVDLAMLVKGVQGFVERARGVLEREEVEVDVLRDVRGQGESLDVVVPELEELGNRIAQGIWVEKGA